MSLITGNQAFVHNFTLLKKKEIPAPIYIHEN